MSSNNLSVNVEVGLLSGSLAVKAGLDETVETLKRRAQAARAVGKQGLLDPHGQILDGTTVKKARLQTGDSLTLQVSRTVACNEQAFAAIRSDGSVVTWGDAACGGDSSAVKEKLHDVQQIQATLGAFAALLADGSVVTWGRRKAGGKSKRSRAAQICADPSVEPGFRCNLGFRV